MQRAFLLASLSLLGTLAIAPAATLTWNGSVSSDFYNPANWSPNGIPAAGDTLNIANGSVSISPVFTNSGQINWTGGTLHGALFVATNGLFALSGSTTKYLDGAITNAGTMTLASGLVYDANWVQIVNQAGALVDLQGDYTIYPGSSWSGMQFINAGTFRKSAGANTCVVTGFPFYNTGTIQSLSGRVDLQSGGALAGTCTAAAAGAAVTFSGGSFTLASGAVFTGPGFVGVANGTPAFSGTLATAMQWSGGSLGGNWSIAASGSLTLSGATTKYLDGAITNAGTMVLASGLSFDANYAQIVNQASGLVDVQGDYPIYPSSSWSGMQIANAGTFRKSAGSGNLTLQIPFVNSGQLAIQSGALSLGTTLTLAPAGTVTGAVIVNNVAINGTLHGSLTWLSGTLYGQLLVANDAVLSLSGAATKYLDGTVTNAGTINVGSGLVFDANNVQLVNQLGAVVDLQGDYPIYPSSSWSGMQFINAGTFRKSGGTNTAAVSGIPFLNTGTAAALSGTLDLQGGGTLAGTCTTIAGTAITFSGGSFGLLPSAVFNGAGFVGMTKGTISLSGTLATVMGWSGGEILGGWSIATNGSFALSGLAGKYLAGQITNAGTMTLASGLVYNANWVQIVNQAGALVDLQGDYTIYPGSSWSGMQFINAGTFRKSAGANTGAVTGFPFYNTGTIQSLSGRVDLQSGGALAGTCTAAAAGAAVTFSGGSFTLASGAVFTGPGFVGVANGTPAFSGTLATAMQWSGGNLGGNWSIAASGSLTLSEAATKYLDGAITNAGTMVLASGFYFDANYAQIVNQASGLVDVQGDYPIYPSSSWSGMQIANAGTFRKSAGSGNLTLQIPFVNSGQLAIQSGALNLGTTLTLAPAGTVTGAVIVNSVAINGTLHGSLTWLSGTLYGQLLVANDAVLTLSGAATKYLDGTVTNAGTINVGSGLVFDANNVQLVNQPGALVDLQGDYPIYPSSSWSGMQFINAGTFRKSGGTNTAPVSGIPFLNTGTVECQRGAFSFDAAFTNAAGSLAVRLNSVGDYGRIAWSGPLAVNGSFSVSLLSGYTPALSNTFQVLTFPSVTGSFASYNGLELGGGLKLTPQLGPTAFSLTVEASSVLPPTISTQPASQTVTAGTNVTFNVTASGTPPLSYLWQFKGTNLTGATDATLTLTNVQLSQAGNYAVRVTNAAGFVLSSNALLTVNSTSGNCVPAPAGFVSWWSGNGSAADSVGTNLGVLLGGATIAPGKVGEAFSFDGVAGWVDIPNPASLNPTGPFSVEVWIKANPQQLTAGGIFLIVDKSHGWTDGTGWLLQGNADGTVGFGYGIGESASAASFPEVNTLSSVLDNQWHHLAGVFTGTQLQIYLDGALQSTLNQTALPVNNQRDAEIGRSWGGGTPTRYFHGLIDEVSYYNRGLSSNEVVAIYAAGSEGKCSVAPVTQPGLRADYRFQNTLLSSVGNPPALSNLGSNAFTTTAVDGVSRTVLTFGFNDGLLLQSGQSVIPSNVYSVVILAALDDVSYYRRLLGFQAIGTDEGWYVHNSRLSYWPVLDGSSEAVASGQFVQFAVTRAADGTVRGYVGGSAAIQFPDALGSVGPGVDGVLRFFADNTTYASAGEVARIRIYDVALTDAQVAALDRLPAAGPTLVMTRAGNNVTVSWPTNFAGYRLRSAPSLAPPVPWTTISNVSVSGPVFQATVGATNNSRFFQLVNP